MEVPPRIYIPSTPIIVCVNTDNVQNFPAVNANNLNVPGGTCLSHNRVDRLNNLCVVTSTLQPQTPVSSAYVVPNRRRVASVLYASVCRRHLSCGCVPCAAVSEPNFESAICSERRLLRTNWPTDLVRLCLNINSGSVRAF